MQSYKDLEIYQLAKTLAIEIHKITLGELPKFEMYEQGSQIRRSSKSIGANIVEGFGRKIYSFRRTVINDMSPVTCDDVVTRRRYKPLQQ